MKRMQTIKNALLDADREIQKAIAHAKDAETLHLRITLVARKLKGTISDLKEIVDHEKSLKR